MENHYEFSKISYKKVSYTQLPQTHTVFSRHPQSYPFIKQLHISNKNYSLNIDIVQKGNFIIFTLINNLASAEYKDYKYFLDSLKNTDKISCNYKQINSYIFFKILVETEKIK